MAHMEDAMTIAALERRAIGLLTNREHSRAEVLNKLRLRQHPAVLIDPVLDDLVRRGLLSDERFAAHYVAHRLDKGWGPLRIRAELEVRGVSELLIRTALEDAAPDWEQRLVAVAQRKFGTTPIEGARDRTRRGRFLTQRGFPLGLVYRYLDRAGRTNRGEPC